LSNKFLNHKKLLKNLKKGNRAAFNYLIKTYYPSLCDYATNLARDDFKSEDIVQNVLVRVWRQRDKLSVDISIKNYLYKSVYNEFIDQYRKEIAITVLEKKYIEGLDIAFENEDEASLDRLITQMKLEIDNLPEKCKDTFLLHKKEGLTYIEISEYKNISIKTVEKHICKAFSILRTKLIRSN